MKSFIQISRQVSDKGYGRFLSYLLVSKFLDEKIKNPDMLIEYSDVDFN